MEALFGLVAAACLCAGYWLGSRSCGRAWQRTASVAAEIVDRLEQDLATARQQVEARDAHLAREVEQARQTQERHDVLTRELLAAAASERSELLDRIATGGTPIGEPLIGMGRKLHHTEADEIEGTTPAKVAAAARAAAESAAGDIAEAEQVMRHIDDIAYAEGIAVQ